MREPSPGAVSVRAAPVPPDSPSQSQPATAADLADLLHRLEHIVRQLHRPEPEVPWERVLRFRDVEVDWATQTIRRGDRPVPVTRTEFRLLLALMRRRGEVASRPELQREVWGPQVVIRSRVIDTHVARLRRKLEADPARPVHILTALNLGYRFQQ